MIKTAKKKIKEVFQGAFIRNVLVLMSGTALAQILAFIASPILSRIFNPDAFGIYGIFTGICGFIVVIADGRYGVAILLPEDDRNAANLLWLSSIIIGITSLLAFILVNLWPGKIAALFNTPELHEVIIWTPFVVFFAALFNAFNFWVTRKKRYSTISYSKAFQSSSKVVTQLGFGMGFGLGSLGLVIGEFIGYIGSFITLLINVIRNDFRLLIESYNPKRILVLAKKYKSFPKYNAPQNLLNNISSNIPSFIFAIFFNPQIVGFYWFTHRVLMKPNSLIGSSVRQVFYQKASELYNNNKHNELLGLYKKTTTNLILIAVVPAFVLFLYGADIFSFIFGSEWLEAGKFAGWLSLWWFSTFINPPSIMMIPIINLLKFQLYFELLLTLLKLIVIIIGGIFDSAILAIVLFSIVGMSSNLFLIGFIGYKIKTK